MNHLLLDPEGGVLPELERLMAGALGGVIYETKLIADMEVCEGGIESILLLRVRRRCEELAHGSLRGRHSAEFGKRGCCCDEMRINLLRLM